MSIIYDALKKIERSQDQIDSSVKINPVRNTKLTNTKNKISNGVNKGGKPRLKIYPVYVLAACLGLFLTAISFNLLTRQSQQDPAPLETNIPNLETNAPIAIPSEVEKESQAPLILNGVFFSEEQGYALINNQIVKEGDVVEGALVLRITLEEVELELNGSTIKLYASR